MPVLPWLLLLAFAAAPQAPALVVTVSPPRGPTGAPWIVQLFEESSEVRKAVDGHPVDSRVTFLDRDGLVSIPFSAKEDGTFEGLLPRDGWWSVTVAADRPHVQTTFDVKVDPVFRDGTPPDVRSGW